VGGEADDAAAVEDEDAVRVAERGEAVGDDEAGAAAHEPVDSALHLGLGDRVEARRGLVEEQDRRVREERAGDGEPLPLSAGELAAPHAEGRVVASRERLDVVVDERGARRRLHLGVRRAGPADADVVANGGGEEERLLGHQRHLRVDVGEAEVAEVAAVEQDAAGARVVEAREEVEERALAAPGGPDDPDRLARAHLERDVLQHRPVAVGEADALERDRARRPREGRGAQALLYLGAGREDLGEALDGGAHRLELDVVRVEVVDRPVHRAHGHDEGEERRPRGLAVEHAVAPEDDDGHDHEPRERVHHDRGEGPAPVIVDHRVEVEPALRDAGLRLRFLAPVGLDDADATQDLEDDVREDVAERAGPVGSRERALGEVKDRECCGGHRGEGAKREPGLEGDRACQEREEQRRLEEHVRERTHGEPELGHVVAHGLQDVGVALAIEEGDREREEVPDQAREHPELHDLADLELGDDVRVVAEARRDLAGEEQAAEHDERGPGAQARGEATHDPGARVAAQRAREEALDHEHDERRRGRAADRGGEEAEEQALLVPEEQRDLIPAGDGREPHLRHPQEVGRAPGPRSAAARS
jgi:hypothetical protein